MYLKLISRIRPNPNTRRLRHNRCKIGGASILWKSTSVEISFWFFSLCGELVGLICNAFLFRQTIALCLYWKHCAVPSCVAEHPMQPAERPMQRITLCVAKVNKAVTYCATNEDMSAASMAALKPRQKLCNGETSFAVKGHSVLFNCREVELKESALCQSMQGTVWWYYCCYSIPMPHNKQTPRTSFSCYDQQRRFMPFDSCRL